jgi:hypothetical protein
MERQEPPLNFNPMHQLNVPGKRTACIRHAGNKRL